MEPLLVKAGVLVVVAIFLWGLRGWSKQRQRYRDYLWEPVTLGELSRETQSHFLKHTATLETLGFRLLGDYRLSAKPLRQFARLLVGPDRRLFVHVGDCAGVRDLAIQSVLSNGIGFETSSYDLGATPPPSPELDRLLFQCSRSQDAGDVLAEHRQVLDQFDEQGTPAIEFAAEDFRKPADYLHRLVHYSLHRQGHVPAVPESAKMYECV